MTPIQVDRVVDAVVRINRFVDRRVGRAERSRSEARVAP
jgi:hypothetical protein